MSLILILLYRHPIPKKKNGNAENKVAGCKQTYVSRIYFISFRFSKSCIKDLKMTGDIFAIVPEADSLYTFVITTPSICQTNAQKIQIFVSANLQKECNLLTNQ